MSSQGLLQVTKLSAVTDQQREQSTNTGQPMPSNGLEFHYELHKQGHGNSLEWISEAQGKSQGALLAPQDDICIWSILLLRQCRWKKPYQCLGMADENVFKDPVFPPWPTLDCFHKVWASMYRCVPLSSFKPPHLHPPHLFLIVLTFSQYCTRSKINTMRPSQPPSQRKRKRSDG